jgi:hypothetical protein
MFSGGARSEHSTITRRFATKTARHERRPNQLHAIQESEE